VLVAASSVHYLTLHSLLIGPIKGGSQSCYQIGEDWTLCQAYSTCSGPSYTPPHSFTHHHPSLVPVDEDSTLCWPLCTCSGQSNAPRHSPASFTFIPTSNSPWRLELNEYLPFLDMYDYINKRPDGSLKHTVYRKPSHYALCAIHLGTQSENLLQTGRSHRRTGIPS
jgi:hypothetical protein